MQVFLERNYHTYMCHLKSPGDEVSWCYGVSCYLQMPLRSDQFIPLIPKQININRCEGLSIVEYKT